MKNKIVIAIALALGPISAYVYRYAASWTKVSEPVTTTVVVASRAIPPGQGWNGMPCGDGGAHRARHPDS